MATAHKLKDAQVERTHMRSTFLPRRARVLAGAALGGAVLCLTVGTPALAMDHPSPGGGECTPGLVEGTAIPTYSHVEKVHLTRSPAQQVSDIRATDDYVLLHTALIDTVTAPARYGAVYIAQEAPKPIGPHLQKVHLERSPAQQVSDIRATDDYVLLHTSLVWSVAVPTFDVINGHDC
jgi:hypothetical protein